MAYQSLYTGAEIDAGIANATAAQTTATDATSILNAHTGDTVIHITAAEREAWNSGAGAALSTTVWAETSSSSTTRTVTIDGATSWDDLLNVPLHIKAGYYGTNTAATLNINGLGTKSLYFPSISTSGVSTTPQYYWVRTGQVYTVVWTGTYLIVTNMQIRQGSTSYAGILQTYAGVDSTSTTQAAAPAAVKTAYDKAVAVETAVGTLNDALAARMAGVI